MRIAATAPPVDQPLRDRFARHCAAFAALWRHPGGRAATSLDLRELRDKLKEELEAWYDKQR